MVTQFRYDVMFPAATRTALFGMEHDTSASIAGINSPWLADLEIFKNAALVVGWRQSHGQLDAVPVPVLADHLGADVWHHVTQTVTQENGIVTTVDGELVPYDPDPAYEYDDPTSSVMFFLAAGRSTAPGGVTFNSVTYYFANLAMQVGGTVTDALDLGDWTQSTSIGGSIDVVTPPVAPPGGGDSYRLVSGVAGEAFMYRNVAPSVVPIATHVVQIVHNA